MMEDPIKVLFLFLFNNTVVYLKDNAHAPGPS